MDTTAGFYAPHLRVGSGGECLGVRLVHGPPQLRPGETAEVVWELMYDGVDYSPLEEGAHFELVEGLRVIGEGEVTSRHAGEISYEFVRGSDLERDGMFLELDRVSGDQRTTVCEVFYSDVDGNLTFTAYEPSALPLEQIEELIRRARALLPPQS